MKGERSEALSPTRRQVLELLWKEPGLSRKGVASRIDIDPATAEHHLHRLQRAGLAIAERAGRIIAYFPNGWGDRLRRREATLSEEARLVIAVVQEAYMPLNASEVAKRAPMPIGKARWALEVAHKAGFLRKRAWGRYEVIG